MRGNHNIGLSVKSNLVQHIVQTPFQRTNENQEGLVVIFSSNIVDMVTIRVAQYKEKVKLY